MSYFVNIFMFSIFLLVFLAYRKVNKTKKYLEMMIDFFGVGFNYRQISKEEFMKISSFCEDILVKKYYFIKETMREGANNEYDIVSYYKTFKEYKKNKTVEIMRIQLIPESAGRSINVAFEGNSPFSDWMRATSQSLLSPAERTSHFVVFSTENFLP